MSPRRVISVMIVGVVAGSTLAQAASPEDSVVRIAAMIRLPSPLRPWVRQNPVEIEGSGVVIKGNRIVTNAHMILYATEITIQGGLGGRRYDAEVVAVSGEVDLALLRLEDESFFKDHPPIAQAENLPRITDTVAVYGYQEGGFGMAVTRGVVTRIDYTLITGGTPGLIIQVDAAVSGGNSGGPALVDGAMVGLVYAQQENIGHILANVEIDRFIEDVSDGKYDGKPRFDYGFEELENEALRAMLKLDQGVQGILVTRLVDLKGKDVLREFDIITAIGPDQIDDEGMIRTPDGLRVSFWYDVERYAKDGKVPFRVLRDGHELDLLVPAPTGRTALLRTFDGELPSFFVVGPLVFSAAYDGTLSYYLQLNPTLLFNQGPLFSRRADDIRFPGEELVMVTAPMLQHRISRGYDDPVGMVLDSINGVPIRNLRHLVETIQDCQDEFLIFRFAGEIGEIQVYRRAELLKATTDLLGQNGIPQQGSPDMMAVWDRE